ncbi:MAG: enoyl-CoA hydratase/isomerase family protein, partial [Bacteroidota bacterium]
QIDNGKVNAINTPLLEEIISTFKALDNDDSVQGAILAGRPHAFSGGLDVMSLATLNDEEAVHFWESYMYALQALVQFSKPLVAAITGYAPAGATILTLCTDYRIMGKGAKHVVGMHEFKMQMQIPEMLCDVYAYHLGEIKAWKAVQNATLFNSDEALAIGLVDESVEVDEVLERAEIYLKKQINIFHKIFSTSKKYFRKQLYRVVVERDVPAIAKETVEFNQDPELRAKVMKFMMSLRKGK